MRETASTDTNPSHVVARLGSRISEAKAMGFHIRQEFLGSQAGSWCEIAGRKTVFLDSSQPAIDQLAILNEALLSYRPALS